MPLYHEHRLLNHHIVIKFERFRYTYRVYRLDPGRHATVLTRSTLVASGTSPSFRVARYRARSIARSSHRRESRWPKPT